MALIFVGYIFTFAHLTVDGFDLLPDFLGYALIAAGAGKLAAHSCSFGWTRICAALESALYLLTFALQWMFLNPEYLDYDPDRIAAIAYASNLLSWLETALTIYIMYSVCRGFAELEEWSRSDLGAKRMTRVFWIHTILLAVTIVMQYLPVTSVTSVVWPALLLAIVALSVAFLVLLYKAKKKYAPAAQG